VNVVCGRPAALATFALIAAAALGGCNRSSAPAPLSAPSTDAWVGQWTGPEGTFLRIAGDEGQYLITIQDLDGPRSFAGHVVRGGIEIARDGRRELIYATDGPGTGMKWLADKRDCLAVRANEGYCRD
jgi:hypothetical protein